MVMWPGVYRKAPANQPHYCRAGSIKAPDNIAARNASTIKSTLDRRRVQVEIHDTTDTQQDNINYKRNVTNLRRTATGQWHQSSASQAHSNTPEYAKTSNSITAVSGRIEQSTD